MDKAPFQPPEPAPPRRFRRRVLPILLVAAGVAIVAAGAIAAAGDPFEPELGSLQEARLTKAAGHLREGQRAGVRALATAPVLLGIKRSKLESIADCESHGDPRAKSSDGLYRGKYQFDRGTWASVGGRGDPAKAPEFEQDVRAATLYKRASSSPWPVCG